MGLSPVDKKLLDWVIPRLVESIHPAELLINLSFVITSDADRNLVLHKAESEGPRVGMFHLLQKYALIANDLTALAKALSLLGHNLYLIIEEGGNNEELREAIEKIVQAKQYIIAQNHDTRAMLDRADSKDPRANGNGIISWLKGIRKRPHSVSMNQKSVPFIRKPSVSSVCTLPSPVLSKPTFSEMSRRHYLGSVPSVTSLSDFEREPTGQMKDNCDAISNFLTEFDEKFGHLIYVFNKQIAHQQIQAEADMEKLRTELKAQFEAMATRSEELNSKLLLQMQADSNENRNSRETEMENIVKTFLEGNAINREKIEEILNQRFTPSLEQQLFDVEVETEISNLNLVEPHELSFPLSKDEYAQTDTNGREIEIQTDNSSQDRDIQCDMQLNPSISLVAGLIGLLVLFAVLVNPATNLFSIPTITHQNLGLDDPQPLITPITPCSELQSNFTGFFKAVVKFVEQTVQLQNRMDWDFEDVSCSSVPIVFPISADIEQETFTSVIDFEKCIQYKLENCARERKRCEKVLIIQLDEEAGEFSVGGSFEHPYPATKVMFMPDPKGQYPDLLATTWDYLRIWKSTESGVQLECLLNNNRNSDFGAPLTSFDWNEIMVIKIIRLCCCLVGICAFGLFFYILYQDGLQEAIVYGFANILVSISFSGHCLMYNYISERFVS